MSSLPVLVLALLFIAAAVVIWIAGVSLSNTVDVLDGRLHLGSALGGTVLLAVATNLPELAITASAALQHALGVAIGNILGGIAIQTVVLVALDRFGVRAAKPLTFQAASLTLVLEGATVVAVLVTVVMGTQLPRHLYALRLTPSSLLVGVIWVVGLLLLRRGGRGLPWTIAGETPENTSAKRGAVKRKRGKQAGDKRRSTGVVALIFVAAAIVTLVAGVVLERSGDALSGHLHLTGVLFGSTVLAAATSLPELSTGLTSAREGDYQLAISDIFGGNAFLPVLFILADLLSGQAVLPQAQASDIYLTGLGALLTVVYVVGLIFRPMRRLLGMGVDSVAVLVLYLIGVAGLFGVA